MKKNAKKTGTKSKGAKGNAKAGGKPKGEPKPKRLSALDAAATVLQNAGNGVSFLSARR